MGLTKYSLGQLLDRNTETNIDLEFGISDVRGVLNSKGISNTKVNVEDRDLSKFLVARPGGFIFNHRVHDKLGLGYNTTDETFIFTNDYVAFYVKPEIAHTVLLPDYLYMWFLRNEFDRYMLFQTYGDTGIVAEIKGVSKSAAEKHAAQLEKWVSQFIEDNGSIPKALLIVNGFCDTPLADRTEEVFPNQMLKYSESRGHILITTTQLLCLYIETQQNPECKDSRIKELLSSVGKYNRYQNINDYLDLE